MTETETESRSRAGNQWSTAMDGPYQDWRAQKLAAVAQIADPTGRVEIRDLVNPSVAERAELVRRCQISNAVYYAAGGKTDELDRLRGQLRGFTSALGMQIAEAHRSAGEFGIVALKQSQDSQRQRYIPYSKRPMNWHTDGYYNGRDQKIRAMILHCARPAQDGGVNQIFDPEIAYMRLRDENPAYIDALMHDGAMTIPENREADGNMRPVSIGPVFSVDAETGHLEMRYTARTRSIKWRDDAMTVRAVRYLNALLASDEPYIQTTKLNAGEGILCNNSLHNRTGFDPKLCGNSDRLIFRVRFHNRVNGS